MRRLERSERCIDSGWALEREGEDLMRVLLVEDDERIAGFMKRGLEAEAYEVDLASEKAQTLALTEAGKYDTIIMDIFLGSDDGLDICRTLRQRSVGTPIVIMTAKDSAETRLASKEAGADAYLPKPFPFEDLVATLKRLHGSTGSVGFPTGPAGGMTLDPGEGQTQRLRFPTDLVQRTMNLDLPGKKHDGYSGFHLSGPASPCRTKEPA
jgi:DNA-binding response OmpR family regulator